MTVVSIVQPYLPIYRVPLFEALAEQLEQSGVELRVLTGVPAGDQRLRNDSVVGQPWQRPLKTHNLFIGQRWLRTYGSMRNWRSSDAVILELASGAADTYLAIASSRRRRVGVWGHVSIPRSRLDHAAICWQLRHADAVFSYTDLGAERAVALGANADAVTVVGNSLETEGLVAALRSLTASEVAEFRESVGAGQGVLVGFIGGLDQSKRIDFLAAALDVLWQRKSDLRLVVAGEGTQKSMLTEAVRRGQVTLLGRVSGKQKALLFAASDALLCPGRIGLLAVESLVSGTPIVTTDWPGHAPEFEYLRPGETCLVTANSAEHYAHGVERVTDHQLREEMRQACLDASPPTLHDAVANLRRGILRLLGEPSD